MYAELIIKESISSIILKKKQKKKKEKKFHLETAQRVMCVWLLSKEKKNIQKAQFSVLIEWTGITET